MDRQTARKYIKAGTSPAEQQAKHTWHTRPDPLTAVWPKVMRPLPAGRLAGYRESHPVVSSHSLRNPDAGSGILGDVEDGWHHLSPALSAILNGSEGEVGWSAIVCGPGKFDGRVRPEAHQVGSKRGPLRPHPGSCRLGRHTGGIARSSRNPRLRAGILPGCPEGVWQWDRLATTAFGVGEFY